MRPTDIEDVTPTELQALIKEYAGNAARGAEFLDGKQKGWADKINLGTLDLQSPCLCVLGQLVPGVEPGGYSNGYQAGINEWFQGDTYSAAEHGFKIAEDRYDAIYESTTDDTPARIRRLTAEYTLLQDAWMPEILKRRTIHGQS